ncbi:MAG TPA: hypothetical protein VM510_13675 [Caulifigura sp.]|nr:hypothetical protein [Caulifigura sp.]
MRLIVLVACVFVVQFSIRAEDRPRFRTDADGPVLAGSTKNGGRDNSGKPPWYQIVDGDFPPEGSAHAISGELISVDHLERTFHLRVDRNDAQDRSVWDLPLEALLLPYGSIDYQGAPAALQDIPLGTHLHGLFYLRAPDDQTPPPVAANNRKTPEIDFRRCFRLEDDFSFRSRQGQLWRIESIDRPGKKLVAVLEQGGAAVGKPQSFDLLSSTRVLRGQGFATQNDLQPGQRVLFNLTWTTLYGPGRIVDVWIDAPSRELAAAHQMERHRNHIRERGLAGWVTAVDDESQIVTITFFGGIDPALFDELAWTNPEPFGWPLSKPESKPLSPKGTIAVARECLMTHDPVNDRKGGNILDIEKIPVEPGSSGVRIRVQCDMLLEGFRPRRVVRFYPATWKVQALPREEQFFGRE